MKGWIVFMILENELSRDNIRLDESITNIEEVTLSALNEVFFGEKPIEDIQRLFSKFRAKYIGKDAFNAKVSYDPDLIKMNRAIEDRFGYKRFSTYILPTFDYNAGMYDIGYLVNDEGIENINKGIRVDKTGNGFKYNKDSAVSCMMQMYYGLIVDGRVTDRELIGIMLHEIGHSFFRAMIGNPGLLTRSSVSLQTMKIVNDMAKGSIKNGDTPNDAAADEAIDKIGFFDKARAFLSKFKGGDEIRGAIHQLSTTVMGKMKKNLQPKYYSYTNEKFADTFASMYGYGADVQSGLQKMESIYGEFYSDLAARKKNPGKISIIIALGKMTLDNNLAILLNVKDEHPDGLTRIKTQIDYLTNELRNTGLDPKMKEDLLKQLDVQRKLIDDYLEAAKNPETRDIYKIFYAKLYEKYGGDKREKYTDNDALFQMIDDRYKNIVRESMIDDSNLASHFGYM